MTKCQTCGLGFAEGVSLFRQNPIGEPGVWACERHLTQPLDPQLAQIAAIVEKGNDPTVH